MAPSTHSTQMYIYMIIGVTAVQSLIARALRESRGGKGSQDATVSRLKVCGREEFLHRWVNNIGQISNNKSVFSTSTQVFLIGSSYVSVGAARVYTNMYTV